MNTLNSIILEGNVSTLVEPVKDTFTFSIASHRHYKNAAGEIQTETSLFEIVTYGQMAEIANKQCQLGRGVRIVGRLKQTQWTEPDGKKWSKVIVIAEHIEFKPMPKKAAL